MIPMSQVRLIDPEDDRPGGVYIGYTEEGDRVRVFRKSKSILPIQKPSKFQYKERVSGKVIGPRDTMPADVVEVGLWVFVYFRLRIRGRISRRFGNSFLKTCGGRR
jgi:hypothetical protein